MNVILSAALLISKQRLLTPNGTLHAAALGIILWSTLGMSGWLFCVAYFAFGSLVTRVKLAEKEVNNMLNGNSNYKIQRLYKCF